MWDKAMKEPPNKKIVFIVAIGCAAVVGLSKVIFEESGWEAAFQKRFGEVTVGIFEILSAVLYFLLVAWWVARWERCSRRYNRWKAGQCLNCSYDLRAHATGANCPECGTPIPTETATMKQTDGSPS
jgi:hypothetical protein